MSYAASRTAEEPARESVPPLQNGDHLTGPEFERRWKATPGLQKAELIEGVVYMAPAVSLRGHGQPHFRMIGLLSQYDLMTPGVVGADNATVRLDLDNLPQPDIFLLIAPELDGPVNVDENEDDVMQGAPQFVCEIAATSASMDLHRKLQLYRRHGVKEYVVWRTLDGQIDYFIERGGDFHKLLPRPSGEFASEVLPGLWLDAASILRNDWQAAARKLQEGIASPEHAAFAQRLAASGKP